MQGLDYVRPDEIQALLVMATASKYVVYASLADTSAAPDVVLQFADTAQSLVLTEAVVRVDGASPTAMGRPACALIPQVVASSQSAASLGCCGVRAYLGNLSNDTTLWGLAGDKIAQYAREIEVLAKANPC
jgi:uncharacterized protein (DUF169 family)